MENIRLIVASVSALLALLSFLMATVLLLLGPSRHIGPDRNSPFMDEDQQ